MAFECENEDHADLKLGPFKQNETKAFQPPHVTPRSAAQSGWFTVHFLAEKEKFFALETQAKFRDRLRKFIVPASKFCDLRYELDRCGINVAALVPGLDGLCQRISWLNSCLADEITH